MLVLDYSLPHVVSTIAIRIGNALERPRVGPAESAHAPVSACIEDKGRRAARYPVHEELVPAGRDGRTHQRSENDAESALALNDAQFAEPACFRMRLRRQIAAAQGRPAPASDPKALL